MSKFSNFVALVMAQIKGDTDTELALKNERKAKSAINGQISALEREILEQQDTIEAAEKAVNDAFAPAKPLASAQVYIDTLGKAQTNLLAEQAKLVRLEESLEFFKSKLKSFEITAD